MSGMVASRLYALLPPLMPMGEKYDLTRSLWLHVCPPSHRVLRIGPDAGLPEITQAIQNYIAETVKGYFIHEGLTKRFQWLSGGDVNVQQQLLNHLMEIEKTAAVNATAQHVPVFLKHIQAEGCKRCREALIAAAV